MKLQETLLNRHGDGLENVVADNVHGSPSLTPEEMMMLREQLEEIEKQASLASQTEPFEVK